MGRYKSIRPVATFTTASLFVLCGLHKHHIASEAVGDTWQGMFVFLCNGMRWGRCGEAMRVKVGGCHIMHPRRVTDSPALNFKSDVSLSFVSGGWGWWGRGDKSYHTKPL